jgi:hypothetical protein
MEEVKRRGRPSAINSEPSVVNTQCVIKDPNMDPFFIIKDSSNFTVMEVSVTTRGFGGKAATGKEQEKIVGHYTSFTNALNRIAKEKFYQNKGNYSTVKEYIATWNEVKNGLDSLLKSIEI